MGRGNKTEFTLLGFSDYPHLQFYISVAIFLTFLISVLGNCLFLILMCSDAHLQKPMYFFLSNLSVLDTCNTLVTLSSMLDNFLTGNSSISFSECMTQLYFFMAFTSTEFFLLSVMAYDRYVAICNPLRYTVIMSKRVCALLAAASWITGFLDMVPVSIMMSQFSFCDASIINHFFCDLTALLKLSCSDNHNIQTVLFVDGSTVGLIPFLSTLASYIYIISTILKIHSSEGRRKAFSTCSSHLTVVLLFYATTICVYMRPTSMYSPNQDKVFALLYTALIPMLNPIIYSLRNQEVKNAMKKIIGGKPKMGVEVVKRNSLEQPLRHNSPSASPQLRVISKNAAKPKKAVQLSPPPLRTGRGKLCNLEAALRRKRSVFPGPATGEDSPDGALQPQDIEMTEADTDLGTSQQPVLEPMDWTQTEGLPEDCCMDWS
uniref:Olfactory receptor 1F1-like n=1 Tax=Geotrypetes seraphini TaxID=260995 RepID=A0A6P8P6A6_GEOSA|nr:olfactory receptor 1F1-like [Geotrypetes seraphini]